jgi:hypothetical protein
MSLRSSRHSLPDRGGANRAPRTAALCGCLPARPSWVSASSAWSSLGGSGGMDFSPVSVAWTTLDRTNLAVKCAMHGPTSADGKGLFCENSAWELAANPVHFRCSLSVPATEGWDKPLYCEPPPDLAINPATHSGSWAGRTRPVLAARSAGSSRPLAPLRRC